MNATKQEAPERQEIEELLPWHAAGTLSRRDAQRVEDALAREAVFPQLQTEAYVAFPYVAATCGIREQYSRALELLLKHKTRLMFPVDYFRWHAARALIAAAAHDQRTARVHSQQALEAAAREHSAFRYHLSVGLVTQQYDEVVKQLEALRAA